MPKYRFPLPQLSAAVGATGWGDAWGELSGLAGCSPRRGTLVSQELTPESLARWLFPHATKCAYRDWLWVPVS